MRKTVCTMANALTAARVLLALPFAFLMTGGGARHATLAALVLAAAIATDVLDGALARRRDTVTAAGRAFDHAADRSEERRVGKSVDRGGRRSIKKKRREERT